MKNTLAEIRETFLDFYRSRDHRVIKSSPIVPREDPTLLFTSAGMVQFKKYYSSTEPLEFRRAASVQKCLRATDLEQVGFTPRHLTFFEMLGHFSFGDYFKREAIHWNWELFTKVFAIPAEKLKVSVFEEDDEAFAIWRDEVGLAETRIYRLGKADNFWGPAGDTGACGPSSEVYYDLGADLGHGRPESGPGNDDDRWIEIGNFVFPQFDMQLDGSMPTLPNRGIDTGIGLERLAMVLEGKRSVFETSIFTPIIRRVEAISGRSYDDPELRSSFHVLADHARSLTFALAEGVFPSNEGRGYVMRRILRRATVQAHRLGIDRPFMSELSSEVVSLFAPFYPEIREQAQSVAMGLQIEEERFSATLEQGLSRFEQAVAETTRAGNRILSGEEVFTLYDTFGFPVDLTRVLARERELDVDEAGFQVAMAEQRERSRSRAKFYQGTAEAMEWIVLSEGEHSVFRGYDHMDLGVRIRRHAPVSRSSDAGAGHATAGSAEGGVEAPVVGDTYWVVLDHTPFYGESGGQVGDQGRLEAPRFRARVLDTQHRGDEIWHRVQVEEGTFPDSEVRAVVDAWRRLDIMANHTGTHLLHAALRQRLGRHVTQAGSLVAPDRLRFDFTHPAALSAEEVQDIERLVNEQILLDQPVGVVQSSYDAAIAEGVMALFGEKYGDEVRRIEIGDFSRELCGGTHCSRTGQIGSLFITTETGIASGTRRIEAVTGRGALASAQRMRGAIDRVRSVVSGSVAELPEKVGAMSEEIVRLRKQVQELKAKGPADWWGPLRDKMESTPGGQLLVGELDVEEGTDLRGLADQIRGQLGSGAGLLLVRSGGKVTLVAMATDDLVQKGTIRADALVREAAQVAGGSGGGKPHLAMAGVRDESKVADALAAGRRSLVAALSS